MGSKLSASFFFVSLMDRLTFFSQRLPAGWAGLGEFTSRGKIMDIFSFLREVGILQTTCPFMFPILPFPLMVNFELVASSVAKIR